MSFFSVNHLSAGYGNGHVIQDVSFDLSQGCLMGVLGANGSGKTTLLKALCGIIPHEGICTLGDTVLEGLPAKQLARRVSYIPQRSGIGIDISVLDVVMMGFNPRLGLLEHPAKSMRDAAIQALHQVGLADQQETNYLHLSEGQKQLCILARTLVSDGKLLLLDEPESALDFHFRYQMLARLRDWIAAQESSAVVTLHDPGLALNFCDKLPLLLEGRVLDIIEPKSDALDKMERALSMVYGAVSLQRCENRGGKEWLVMLREG